jgi:catechol 2,3-dioxygenase-like lactoylglutathione lyase family enzyme
MASTSAIPTRGLRHLALNVADVSASVEFYSSLFGMRVVWQPDPDNAYLSSGCDNLALHRTPTEALQSGQRLDHLGFIVETLEDVDRAAEVLAARRIPLLRPPRTHRDGSRSLYFADPDGNVIQVLYEPTLSAQHLG